MGDSINETEQKFGSSRHQYLAAIIANLNFLAHGSIIGWLSPALPVLLSEETPLKTGPLTNEELSWVGSINGLAAIFGSFTAGIVVGFFGPKRTLLILMLPPTTFWVLVFFGDTYYYILIARFFTGLTAGGLQTATILYISDIANNDIRGRLGSIAQLTRNLGILLIFILGAFLQYKTLCVFFIIPLAFGISFAFLPNTPQFHLKRGQFKKAEKSLKFYKGCNEKSIDQKIALDAEFERLKTVACAQKNDEKVTWDDILNRKALIGLTNGIILANLQHLTGYLVLITYASMIFDQVGISNIDPNISSISLAVLQLLGTLCSTRFSDTLGRKMLLIVSLLGSAFGMLSFAVYSYLKQGGHELTSLEWIPILSLSFVIFTASAGSVPLLTICVVEIVPSKIRTESLTTCNIFANVASFYCSKLFPILSASIGLHGSMGIMATACILGSFYLYLALEETKGKALDSVPSEDEICAKNNC